MKKLLSIALAVCMVITSFAVYASASETVELPATTIALKADSPVGVVGYRVTQINEDDASVVPYVEDGEFYVPTCIVNETYGLELSGTHVAASDLAASGLYAYWQEEAGTLQNYAMVSSEFTEEIFTASGRGGYESKLIRIPSVEELYNYDLGNAEYVWAELPAGTYDMLYPTTTYYPGMNMAGFGMNQVNAGKYNQFASKDLYQPKELDADKKGALLTETIDGSDYYYESSYNVSYYIPGTYYINDDTDGFNLLFFMDGTDYTRNDAIKNCLDNLIYTEAIDPTIAVFMPAGGGDGAGYPLLSSLGFGSRSIEYDSVDSRYADFVVDTVLPSLDIGLWGSDATYQLNADTETHTAIGHSSSGNAAMGLAWHRNEVFGSVVMSCASISDMRQGNLWHTAIRANDRKDIKFFLIEGQYDHDLIYASWPLANAQFAQSLEYRGYEFMFVEHESSHDANPISNSLSQILGWLWNDEAFYDDYLNIVLSSEPIVTDEAAVATENERGVVDCVTVTAGEDKTVSLDIGSLDVRYHSVHAENANDLEHFSLEYLAGRRGYTFSAVSSDESIATVAVGGENLKGGAADTLTITGVAEGTVTVTLTKDLPTGTRVPEAFDPFTVTIEVTVAPAV